MSERGALGRRAVRADDEGALLDVRDAADFLRLHPRTLAELAREGRIPAKKVGGVWRFSRAALEAWIGGEGAQFERTLPAEEIGDDRPRLLVVDDEALVRELVVAALNEAYAVRTLGTGAEALLEIGLTRPDVVILDHILPDVPGLEVCRLLRARPELDRVAIIILTGVDDQAQTAAALHIGADDYVTKPFRPVELRARIYRLLVRTGRVRAREA